MRGVIGINIFGKQCSAAKNGCYSDRSGCECVCLVCKLQADGRCLARPRRLCATWICLQGAWCIVSMDTPVRPFQLSTLSICGSGNRHDCVFTKFSNIISYYIYHFLFNLQFGGPEPDEGVSSNRFFISHSV